MTTEQNETLIKTPLFSFSGKGKQTAELITTLALVCLGLIGWVLYEHKIETKEHAQELARTFDKGLTEMNRAQREQNRILREQVCLLSIAPEKREREFMNDNSLCKRISSERN